MLDGAGGLKDRGRWHNVGHPVVYLAESSALAILEVLVRQPRSRLPPPFQLLEIDAGASLDVISAPFESPLPHRDITAAWGDDFLKGTAAPLARVPSVVAPKGWNYLLNPLHPDAARVTVTTAARWPWDARLFAGR